MSIIENSINIVSRVEIERIKRKNPSTVGESRAALLLRITARFLRRDPEGLTRDRFLNIRRRLMARPARGGKKISGRRGRRRDTATRSHFAFLRESAEKRSSDVLTPCEPTQGRQSSPSSSSQESTAVGFLPFQVSREDQADSGGGQHLAGSRAIACVPDPRD